MPTPQPTHQQGRVALFVTLGVGIVAASLLTFQFVRGHHEDKAKKVVTSQSNSRQTKSQIPSGWKTYEDQDGAKFKFAYPDDWEVSNRRTIATAKGEQGWHLTLAAKHAENGDPSISIDTYPENASIRNVDAGQNDLKVKSVNAVDGQTLTLAGNIEDPSHVTRPTQMYLSSCWPRNCTPRLKNGRFINFAIGATNNDCVRGMLCPTEIDTEGKNYKLFLEILKTIESHSSN